MNFLWWMNAGARRVFEQVLRGPGEEEAQEAAPGKLKRAANYFSTHPLSPDRILALEARAQAEGWELSGSSEPWFAGDATEALVDDEAPEAH